MSVNSNNYLENNYFTHIYVEEEVKDHPRTKQILLRFPKAKIISITHYKDVFNRTHQNFLKQKNSPNLILAKKQGEFIFNGAPVCQGFGEEYFYYTSSIMNCLYDCEYCYLQGMYPSANLVVFVNLEDIFSHVTRLLKKHKAYLCISYDTDLLALEGLFGFVSAWCDYAKHHTDLTIEIRTKNANKEALKALPVLSNVIYAFTLSPESVIKNYEHGTPSLYTRIKAIKTALSLGHPVRLCFDPMIYIADYQEVYENFFNFLWTQISPKSIRDISLGVFRVSKDYLKRMRKQRPGSAILQYPYEPEDGVAHYGRETSKEMMFFAYQKLTEYYDKERIFLWDEAFPIILSL